MAHEIIIDSYEELENGAALSMTAGSLPISTANRIVHNKLEEISDEDIYQAQSALEEATQLIRQILGQEIHPGTANDWHNFAVEVARSDLYDLTCDILEKSLELFPKNTDLLADYLQYGIACGRIEKCKSVYKSLAKIPKVRYTWRAYSFSVNWLQYLWERSDSEKELERLQKEMQDLAAAFRKNMPDDEESYRCDADIYKLIHNKKEEERVLRQALDELKIAPKCALRLADMLFERGEYEDAMVQIQRGINDANQTQESINEGYMYCLLGLSRMAVVVRSGGTFDEASANAIYADFDMALKIDKNSNYRKTMRNKTTAIMSKSGVPVDDKYEELAYLVQ